MIPTLLLWVLILNASLRPAENHANVFENVRDYEVVRPIKLHTITKRHAAHLRPDTINYAMTVGGKDIELQLEKNIKLLTKDYTETYYQEDGTRVTEAPDDIDHCYYHGRIINDIESSVSISTCDGLRGYFRTSAQRYLIEPLPGGNEGDHAVMTFNESSSTPAVCGVTNTSWGADPEPPTSRSRSRSGGLNIVQQQKYIELYIVADNREYVKWKKDQTVLRKRIFEIVNYVNMVYKPMRTFIALVGIEIWSNADLITVTPPAGANLDAFMNWRNSDLIKRKNHDNAHLLSAIDFEGSTVGLAFVGTLCSGHSVGVIQDHNDRAIAVGATLAHEMGHNLGMNHDDSSACTCSAESCIMAAALSWNIPRTFSSCSANNYENYLTSRSPSCLLDKPDYKSIIAPPVCGNGFVETGEQCDCGTVEECTNPCCNASTCSLTQGSQCAEGECCDNCKILSRSSECRRKQDDCDLAEYCDGERAVCPEDVFSVNGLPCEGGLGHCYNGKCPQRPNQCIRMYGSNAAEAAPDCYNYNTKGLYYAFCKRPAKDQFIPCQKPDVLCGKLFCTGGNDNPNYGRMVRINNCKAAFFDDYTQDFGQVDAGTKCGNGKVCSLYQCVDLETAYRNTNCSAKCPGHGVCNHRSECQCEPGWLPPNCNSKDAAFAPLQPGVVAAIVVIVAILVLGIAGTAVFIWRKRRIHTIPTAHTHGKQVPVYNHHVRRDQVPTQPAPVTQTGTPKPKGPPPPPPPTGIKPQPPTNTYTNARQALRPVPPPKV